MPPLPRPVRVQRWCLQLGFGGDKVSWSRFSPAKPAAVFPSTVRGSPVYLKGTGKDVMQPLRTGWMTCFFSYCNDGDS